MNNRHTTIKPRKTLAQRSVFSAWRIPAALCLALFLVSFNVYVMTVLIAAVVRGLDTTVAHVVSALVLFPLMVASLVPTSQIVGLIYGQKKLFAGGLLLFALGVAVTAFSPNVLVLILGYSIITGLAATPLVTVPWILIEQSADRVKQFGIIAFGAAALAGSLIGPLTGGLIATAAHWRWGFAPQLVLVIVILWLLKPVAETERRGDISVDWIGALLSFLGLAAVLVGMSLAGEYGWWAPKKIIRLQGWIIPPFGLSIVPVLIASGVILLSVFLFYWRRRAIRQRTAKLWRAGVFRHRQFATGLLTSALYMITTSGVTFALYLLLPAVLDLSPLATSLAVMPFNIAMLVVMLATARLNRNMIILPKTLVQYGLGALAAGLLLLHVAMIPGFSILGLLPGLIVAGAGAGLIVEQIAWLTLAAATQEESAEARGIYNTTQDLGYALGLSVFGMLLIYLASVGVVDEVLERANIIVDERERQEIIVTLEQELQTLSEEEFDAMLAQQPEEIQRTLEQIAPAALSEAMQATLLGLIAVVLLALLVSGLLPRVPAAAD
jgi:MFS family permease